MASISQVGVLRGLVPGRGFHRHGFLRPHGAAVERGTAELAAHSMGPPQRRAVCPLVGCGKLDIDTKNKLETCFAK